MLKEILKFNELDSEFEAFNKNIANGIPFACFNVPQSFKPVFLINGEKVLYIAKDEIEANSVYAVLINNRDDVVLLKAKDELLLSFAAMSKENEYKRLFALGKIAEKKAKIIITTIEALMQPFPHFETFKNSIIKLKENEDIDMDVLIEKLVAMGFKREERASYLGQFSRRGDIIDIVGIDGSSVRLDFFGDTLESIKVIDIETQKSTKKIKEFTVYPATDLLCFKTDLDSIEKLLLKDVEAFKKKGDEESIASIEELTSETLIALKQKDISKSSFSLLSLCDYGNIADFLDEDFIVMFDEISRLEDSAKNISYDFGTRFIELYKRGSVLKTQMNLLKQKEEVFGLLAKRRNVAISSLSMVKSDFRYLDGISLKITATGGYFGDYELLKKDIQNWLISGYKIAICSLNTDNAKVILRELEDKGMSVPIKDSFDDEVNVIITKDYLEKGFILHESKIVVIGAYDLIKKGKKKGISSKASKTDVFTAPMIGDYVVHEVHGIGLFKGITHINTSGTGRDYAAIQYRDNDMLYVPVDQMDLLVKFSGSDKEPKLSKMGGKEFGVIKERVKASLKEMAVNLKTLYKKRQETKGFKYTVDSVLQKEFEDKFPYTETPDQLRSIGEIKQDMESGKVMERLLCGDVGYGKTEVALRAAFKTVENGKQVCFLSPTTVLSKQHYNTCVKRFEGFGIRVDFLNRFKTKEQQKEVLKRLKNWEIDVICGTHRMLSKDVEFFDLGLLILDEEQRFGVEHKEKIKAIKENVNVLSMSATPIPRTLHMSLTGIRDISVIETPPEKRLPVQTFVMEENDSYIKDAITRELGRNGQVFIIYNKVGNIENFTAKIKGLIKDARIEYAHGQMQGNILEKRIMSFYNGDIDVLICSTIVENGIDIPRANTMIVIDADKLGLSELYQLRGRVGRSDRLAYVYFTYKKDKVLSEKAFKRLSAIMEFTEFGSGFKIAMRDLEIRGAGNILGREQSGHLAEVGYDMYCKLLKEAADDKPHGQRGEVEIDMDINAYIPDNYVESGNGRMDCYREIVLIKDEKDAKAIIEKFTDIYGPPPTEVLNLTHIPIIKRLLNNIDAIKIAKRNDVYYITLSESSLKNEKLFKAMDIFKQNILLKVSDKAIINFAVKNKTDYFVEIMDFLKAACK